MRCLRAIVTLPSLKKGKKEKKKSAEAGMGERSGNRWQTKKLQGCGSVLADPLLEVYCHRKKKRELKGMKQTKKNQKGDTKNSERNGTKEGTSFY